MKLLFYEVIYIYGKLWLPSTAVCEKVGAMSCALIKIKLFPGCISKCAWGIYMEGRGDIGVGGQQPSSVRTIMSGRYILPFVFFAACASGNIQTYIILEHQIPAHA